jgi:hypothetical protein
LWFRYACAGSGQQGVDPGEQLPGALQGGIVKLRQERRLVGEEVVRRRVVAELAGGDVVVVEVLLDAAGGLRSCRPVIVMPLTDL